MTDIVERSDDGGVVTLRLNRPDRRNALTTGLLRSLAAEVAAVADSPQARVLVLSGTGPTFCAGADLQEFPPGSPAEGAVRRVRMVGQVVGLLRNLEQPTIAVVQGAAYGAGWGLALACDLCYAAADATFCLPEVTRGLRLPPAISARLVEVVGPVRAAEIALAGEAQGTEAGLAAGWVARSFADGDGTARAADELAHRLAAQPRAAVNAVKQVLRQGPDRVLSPPPEYAWNEE